MMVVDAWSGHTYSIKRRGKRVEEKVEEVENFYVKKKVNVTKMYLESESIKRRHAL